MKHATLQIKLLCLTAVLVLCLPLLAACNQSGADIETTEQTTAAPTTEQPQEQTTASDTEDTTMAETEPATETEAETETTERRPLRITQTATIFIAIPPLARRRIFRETELSTRSASGCSLLNLGSRRRLFRQHNYFSKAKEIECHLV